MTTVTQIITDAFRQSNLLAISISPTSDEQTEALRYLNRIVKSVFGNEVGENLTAIPVGRNNIDRPAGYPGWDNVPDNNWFVPKNVRVVLNQNQSNGLYLHPSPDDGSRIAIIDTSDNLSTYPVTLYGNGRLIENSFSVTIDIDGADFEWFYRADLANWLKYSPLDLDDTFPFPEEFDDFFITMLAIRLNPSFGISLDGQSEAVLNRARSQIRSRYTQITPIPSELALLRMPRVSAERRQWEDYYWFYDPSSMFERGWPW